MVSSVIVTIVIVLGIIVAGGFLIYFIGDLLMGLAGKKDSQAIMEKQLKGQKELEKRVEALENSKEAKKDPDIAAVLFNGAVVEEYDPNEVEVVEEEYDPNETEKVSESVEAESEASEETAEEKVEETKADEEKVEEVVEEAEEADEEIDDTAEYIRQRRAELMERLAKMQEEQEAEEESVDLEETEEVEEIIEEAEETSEEVVEESEKPETVAEEATEAEESDKKVVAGPLANLTLEELEARLAEEQEKLKDNEKDLRHCKKEYIPLRRVKKTLESDEKKLRRKEALVAKQKVVLYGVNNYADIDEEKAKKLAEDLDLLDGLKLSVQHCQEVMDKNEERYPLLEKIYTLLSSQNEEIKADIKDLQDAIASLKGDNSDTDAE